MEVEKPITLEERKAECKPLVLVVDDNPQYAKLFDLIADTLGITVHIVDCCSEAVQALQKFSFDIVLMDWMMPQVDGPMCTARIREFEKESGRHTPIIGVSGYIKANRQQCLDAGMDDFLTVPFTLEQLHEKLCYWLQQKKE